MTSLARGEGETTARCCAAAFGPVSRNAALLTSPKRSNCSSTRNAELVDDQFGSVVQRSLSDRATEAPSDHQSLYFRNFPVISTLTRSPLGFGTRVMTISKSIADMIPSPNFS